MCSRIITLCSVTFGLFVAGCSGNSNTDRAVVSQSENSSVFVQDGQAVSEVGNSEVTPDYSSIEYDQSAYPTIRLGQHDYLEYVELLKNSKGGTLVFPAGEFLFSGVNNGITQLSFTGLEFLEIIGSGSSTVLKLDKLNDYNQVRLLSVFDSANILLKNIVLDGSIRKWLNFPESFEQQSNVFIRRSKNIIIDGVATNNAFGDGINIGDVEDVVIERTHFNNLARNGLTIGHGYTENVLVTESTFASSIDTQQIDMEHGNSKNVHISGNIFHKHEDIDVVANDQFSIVVSDSFQSSIVNNEVYSAILIRDSQDIIVQDNNNIPGLRIDRSSKRVFVENNSFNLTPIPQVDPELQTGILIRQGQDIYPENIRLKFNKVNTRNLPVGLIVRDVFNFNISENDFVYDGVATTDAIIHAQTIDIEGIYRNNNVLDENSIYVRTLGVDIVESLDFKVVLTD